MKLLDIMKKYDRCLVRESAKLTKIYNMILKESENEKVDEDVCPDCGNDPCICDSDDMSEDDDMVSARELCSETDDVDECGLIPEEDFFKTEEEVEENDMLRNRPHNGHIDDPAGVVSEKDEECEDGSCNEEDTQMMSAAEFFAEAGKDELDEDEGLDDTTSSENESECNEDVEMMSAEEFFSEAKNDEVDESFEGIDADDMVSARELLAEKDEDKDDVSEKDEEDEEAKQLQESLKSYRRKNHHLFNS